MPNCEEMEDALSTLNAMLPTKRLKFINDFLLDNDDALAILTDYMLSKEIIEPEESIDHMKEYRKDNPMDRVTWERVA